MDTYQARRERVFAALARHRPSTRPPRDIPAAGCMSGMALATVAILLLAATALLGAQYLGAPQLQQVKAPRLVSWSLLAAAMPMYVYLLGRFMGSGVGDMFAGFFNATALAVLRLCGDSFLLTTEQATKLARVCKQYPPLAQACIDWGVRTQGAALTSREFACLVRAADKIALIDHEEFHEKARLAEQLRMREALNQNGLLDQIQAHVQARQLDSSTQSSTASRPRGRL